MQLQQVRGRNQLLQQLVQTLQNQIKSKNKQQNIVMEQLDHVVKDNDSIMAKYSILLAESRKWTQKQKYYQHLLAQLEENLAKTHQQLIQTQRRLTVHSQTVINAKPDSDPISNRSGPQSHLLHNSAVSGTPQPIHIPSYLCASLPTINPQNNPHQGQKYLSASSASFQSLSCRNQQGFLASTPNQENQPAEQSHPAQQPNSNLKLQLQLKSLKTLSQTLKLQITRKDLQLKSKNQKLTQTSKQIQSLQEQLQHIHDVLDEMRKQNSELVEDLGQKVSQISYKDQKYFEMYKQMDQEWKVKYEKLQQDNKALQYSKEDCFRELEAKEEEVRNIRQGVSRLNLKVQTLEVQIQQIKAENQTLKTTSQSFGQENQSLRTEIQEVKRQNQAKKTKIEQTQRQNQAIKSEIQQTQKQNQAIKNEIQLTQKQNKSLIQKIEQLDLNIATINEHNQSLERQVLTTKTQNDQANESIDQLINQKQQQQLQQLTQLINQNQLANDKALEVSSVQNNQMKDQVAQQQKGSQENLNLNQNQGSVSLQAMNQQLQIQVGRLCVSCQQKCTEIQNLRSQLASLWQENSSKQDTIAQLRVSEQQLLSRIIAPKEQQRQEERSGQGVSHQTKINVIQRYEDDLHRPKSVPRMEQRIIKPYQNAQNLVQNYLSSARSNADKNSNIRTPDDSQGQNEGFIFKIVPAQRKSDLPLLNTEFASRLQKPNHQKQSSSCSDQGVEQLGLPSTGFDINYLRNSIAWFGLDIDFNSIAKHIGFDIDEQKQLEQKAYSSQERQTEQTPSHCQDHNAVETSRWNSFAIKNKQFDSSYGSNLCQSNKPSATDRLHAPGIDEQLMRSSYGSNNQFTQIVLYYQQQINKFKEKIHELTQQITKEKKLEEQKIHDLEKEMRQLQVVLKSKQQMLEQVAKENWENNQKVQQLEELLTEVKNQLEFKQRQECSRQIQAQAMQQQRQSNTEVIETTQFRTSIQPRMAANIKQNRALISLSPEQQYETVQLISQLSTQLECLQQSLTQAQRECAGQIDKNETLNAGNLYLVKELQLLKKDYENMVNQFSELSLQQNNQILGLKAQSVQANDQMLGLKDQILQINSEFNKVKDENEQLMKINKELFDQQEQLIQERLRIAKEQTQHQFQQVLYEQVQKLNKLNWSKQSQSSRKQSKTIDELQKQISSLQVKVEGQQSCLDKIYNQPQIQKLNQQLQISLSKMQQVTQHNQKVVEEKQHQIKRLQKLLKQSKEQAIKLLNENQTLAKQYSKLVRVVKQLQVMSRRCVDLQNSNRSLQETLSRLTSGRPSIQGNQSPFYNNTQQRQRTSDLMWQMSPKGQDHFAINNISNIHAMVEQLQDDSFALHQKDKQYTTLKDLTQKMRVENQQLQTEVKQKDSQVIELEEELTTIQNQFNAQIMGLKKCNAQLNSQLLRLKKQLFSYQKQTGNIGKFIQQNFMPNANGAGLQRCYPSHQKYGSISPNFKKYANRSNNSFNLDIYNSQDQSQLSRKNTGDMTNFYPKKECLQNSLNMGQIFMGRKTKPRNFNNTQKYTSLSQTFRAMTSTDFTGFKHKTNVSPLETSIFRAQTTF